MTNLIDFAQWLKKEIQIRGWRQADLARAARIDSSVFSRILNLEREPSPETCRAIARALNLPPETVFRRAGLLPAKPNEPVDEPSVREMVHLYSQLNNRDQEEVLTVVRALVREKLSHYEPQTKTAKS
jgi:transcriptional regulator with XRE-family HTH domain